MAQGIFFSSLKFQIRNPIVFSPDDTSTRDSLDVPVMRSIIDRDIARLEESIRALKSRRNELSPISRLPVEILCNIFSLRLIEGNIYCSSRNPKSWTNFSQVSQHWRTTALSAPELWTEIPLSYPRWAQEMLIRSKMAKLTIRSGFSFDASNTKAIETVRLCLYEMNRVEELKLPTIPGSILEKFFRDSPKSAPQLHTLCIGSHSFRFVKGFSVHEDFFCDTERLQRVELINCKISWDSRLLTGLTRLRLEDSLKANSSIIQVLHALQRMPALTDLRLHDSIPDDSEGPSTYPVVDLPCLRVLHISSGVGALTTVLRHITIPPSAIKNLTCREKQSTQIDFTNFLSVLATKFLSSLVIRSLDLQVIDDTGLEFNFWTTASRSQLQLLQLVLTWPSPQPRNHVKALTCAFDAMSLPFLTQLQISTLDYIDSQTWVKTFGKLPLLKRVCVQSSASYSFLEALVYKAKAAEKSKTAYCNVSFPKLRHISLEGTDFSARDPRSTSVDMLLDCLTERCERKAAVQVLCLDDCYDIWSDDVERLKEIVVDVTWDGIEQEVSDEDKEYDSDGNTIDSDDLDYEYDGFPLGFW
jgi:hypothetical protein